MVRRVAYPAIAAALIATLNGCSLNPFGLERREVWRAEAESACMASRPFRRDDYIVEVREISDQGVCGMEQPLRVSAMLDGTVAVGPAATLGCPVTVALEQWIAASVQPAAVARFGSQVVAIHQMSAYACRSRNNVAGAELSEHAFGNALDVGSFELANGRVVTVEEGWNGAQDERDFLREVHATACEYFTTVLGPGSDANHYNHFHLDLARHNAAGTSHYCRPTPVMPAPAGQPVFNVPIALAQEAVPTSAAPAGDADLLARIIATATVD